MENGDLSVAFGSVSLRKPEPKAGVKWGRGSSGLGAGFYLSPREAEKCTRNANTTTHHVSYRETPLHDVRR